MATTAGAWVSLALIAVTLIFAAMGVEATAQGLEIRLTGRCSVLRQPWRPSSSWPAGSTRHSKSRCGYGRAGGSLPDLPPLVVGVFAVGIIRQLIRPEWIQALAGENTLLANLAGVVFGVFMYFPTLVEVPIAKMFLSLGCTRGR